MNSFVYLPYTSPYPFLNAMPLVPEYDQFPISHLNQEQNIPSEDLVPPKRHKNAYERRNVYKSIIRHTSKYIQKNRREVTNKLKKEKFGEESIQVAFQEIEVSAKRENEKGKPKNSKKSLEEMLASKTIYAHILKESLELMINNWQRGSKGKVLRENLQTYKEVCEGYLTRINNIISNHQT